MTPFSHPWTTPRQTPPFNEIKTEHYLPAFEEAIIEAKQDIEDGKGRSFSNADEMNAWLNSL